MSDKNPWHVRRLGAAAAATTPIGQGVPQYGLVQDLSTAQWQSTDQFMAAMRDFASQRAEAYQQVLEQQHQQQLAYAQSLSDMGALDLNRKKHDHGHNWFTKATDELMAEADTMKQGLGAGISALSQGHLFVSQDAGNYEAYKAKGGLLTEDEYNSLDPMVQGYITDKASMGKDLAALMATPLVGPALHATGEGLSDAFRGISVPFLMVAQARHKNPLANFVDPMWFKPGRYSQAWRASQDQSLGNAIVNSVMSPYKSDEQLAEWKKNSSVYQLSSTLSEFGVLWVADPGVITAKGAGAALRLGRGELPLNEHSAQYIATTQALQGETITVRGPAKAMGEFRANRMRANWPGVIDYARTHTFTDFADRKMFRDRDIEGQAIAHATYWAARHGSPEQLDLTMRLAHADPKAWEEFAAMRDSIPDQLQPWADGFQSFADGLRAAQTKLPGLEREVEDLQRLSEAPDLTGYHQWEVHAQLADKQADLAKLQDALAKYGEGYRSWLDSASLLPEVSRVGTSPRSRFFMDNQFGSTHRVVKWTRGAFIHTANAFNVNDLDMGVQSIRRMTEQFDHLMGYRNPEALDETLLHFMEARTPLERHQIAFDYQRRHFIAAAAQKLGVNPGTVETIFDHAVAKQNEVLAKVMEGDGAHFSGAPDVAGRLEQGDQGIQLVSRDPDNGMVTLNLINGRHVDQITVPEFATRGTIRPATMDGTSEIFNPLNTREFWLQLKRHSDVIQEMHHAGIHSAEALAMNSVDFLGTMFNRLWKPLVLFRLGWPQRVLMDEQMRALAVLGATGFARYYGSDMARAANNAGLASAQLVHEAGVKVVNASRNAINMLVHDPAFARRYNINRDLPAGPGPVAEATKRTMSPIVRDKVVAKAPKVPEEFTPVLDSARLEKIAAHVADHETWRRSYYKWKAWHRENDRQRAARVHTLMGPDGAPTGLQSKLLDHALEAEDQTFYYNVPDMAESHPMHKILHQWESEVWNASEGGFGHRHWATTGEALSRGPRVYDPVTGNEVKSGYAVPMEDTKFTVAQSPSVDEMQLAMRDWYARHHELLASRGFRILITPEGDLHVARTFSRTERKKAERLGAAASGTMHNLHGRISYTFKDWNDLSPTLEAAYRQFVFDGKSERIATEGNAPFGGPKHLEGSSTVYHGTPPEATELPEILLPRWLAPDLHGRLAGPGFYTSINPEIGLGFGGKLYTIVGSRDGRKYKIFDLDKPVTEKDLKRLQKYLDKERPRGVEPGRADWDVAAQVLKHRFHNTDKHLIERYDTEPHEDPTWLDYFRDLEFRSKDAQELLTTYLEDVHNAGALTMVGGRWLGAGDHRVHVWLHPENLLVKPAYVDTGEFLPLKQWLSHPQSLENPVPENRIVRTGTRNPLFPALHQNHALLHERLQSLEGKARHTDRVVLELARREKGLMNQLGLEYSRYRGEDLYHDKYINDTIGQDWYIQTDPGRFDRIVEEAKAEDKYHATTRQEIADLQLHNFDREADDAGNRFMRSIIRHRESGKGYSMMQSSDGRTVAYRNAFEGHEGALLRGDVSAQGAYEALSEGLGASTHWLMKQGRGQKTYTPPAMSGRALQKGTKEYRVAQTYYAEWSDLLNTKVAQSPIFSKMLNGWTDQRISHWLDNTAEGSAVRNQHMSKGQITELWVNEHRAMLGHYLPNQKLQRLLAKDRLSPSQLRREVPEDLRPDIFAPEVEHLTAVNAGLGRLAKFAVDRAWYGLGTVPTNVLSRHPFARAMYDLKMKSQIARTAGEHLDHDTLVQMERRAAKFARDQVEKTLWSLTDQTNFSQFLRFVSPFWGAQYEALTKWSKIIADRPEIVARIFSLQQAVYDNYKMVDADGKVIQPGDRNHFSYHPSDRVIIRIPPVMRHTPMGKALESIGEVGIPIGSANVVLQGEFPLLPGPGPLVTIAADKFLRKMSDIYGTQFDGKFLYNWLFPIGRPQDGGIKGVLDQVTPAWGKKLMQLQEGDGGVAYSNLYRQVANEMAFENQQKGLKPPTPAEIEKQVHWLEGLKIVTGLLAPVQVEYRPKHQFFIDAAHKMRDQYGQDWMDHFFDEYGIAARRYVVASSNSTVDIPPTSQGMEEWSQNKKLIAKYQDWAGAIISPDAYKDDFNSDAYYAQFDINLGPGNDTRLRTKVDEKTAADTADARAGWYEFRKVQSMIDAELARRGLHSISQKGAEDLNRAKINFVADLTRKLPAWRHEYDDFANHIYERVHQLSLWAFRPEFDNRPDIQGVRQYLMVRSQVAAELDRYAATTGGSRSLEAKENTALRDWFYDQVGQLVQANPAFGELYARYLTSDKLEQGSGGFINATQ